MYTKILLVVVILVLSAFFYLHTQNPEVVTFVVTAERTYTMPVTLILFVGFFAGAMLAVFNSLLVDAKRAIREMRARKEKRLLAEADDNYRKGVEALSNGDILDARSLIEKASKAKPFDPSMVISLAETYVRENRQKDAMKVLENGFLNTSNSIRILIELAKCAEDSGDVFRAVKTYEEVVRLDPRNPFALRKLRDYRIREAQWADAAAVQKTIVEREPEENTRAREKRLLTGLLFESASRLVEEGRLGEAVAKVKEVLKSDDTFMPAHVLLGELLARQGNHASAIKVWEKAQGRYQHSEPLILKLEEIYLKESAPDKILEKYQREISARPDDVNLRLLLSRLYLRLEMVDAAIEELERIHLDGEESFYPLMLLGEAYLRRKQSGKAAHLFQRVLGLDREYQPPFFCQRCGNNAKTWTPRCSSCGEWNCMQMSGATVVSARPSQAASVSQAPASVITIRR